MKTEKIAFIGAGNMASALIGGLISDGFPSKNIWATDVNDNRLTLLEEQCNINTSSDNKVVVSNADVIVLCVKPQSMKSVCEEIKPVLVEKQVLVISIAAGIDNKSLTSWLGDKLALVRAMPNTPALIKAGATGLFANNNVSSDQKDQAETILRAVGVVLWLQDEAQMNLVTALSGSGPAYFFRVMESMEKAACELGLPPEAAHVLTVQTAIGAAKLALESDDTLATLREKVTSPGGTTEKGLNAMQQANVESMFYETIKSASERAAELAKEYGEN